MNEHIKQLIINNNHKKLKYFLDKKENFLKTNQNNYELMQLAIRNGSIKCAKLLNVNGVEYNVLDLLNRSLLFDAVNGNSKESLLFLLEFGLNVNSVDKNGQTPLMIASSNGTCDSTMVRLLIEQGADINILDKNVESALFSAAFSLGFSNLNAVKILIKNGCKTNIENKYGQTVLTKAAAAYNAEDVVNIFIDIGLNVNHEDIYGKTPLFYAIESDNVESFDLLLENNAHINIVDKNGVSPLMKARQKLNPYLEKQLLKMGAIK